MKSFGTLLAGALCATAVIAAASAASAATTTLYSDLGPGQSYNGSSAWVAAPEKTMSFVAAASGSVSQIDLALQNFSSDSATVSLWTNSGGGLGAELGSWAVSGFPDFGSVSSGALTTIAEISGIALTAGDAYSLRVASSGAAWNFNSQGVAAPGGPAGAFDVLGVAGVPEPATWAMLILGVGMIGFAARRRNAVAALAA